MIIINWIILRDIEEEEGGRELGEGQ